MTRVYSALLEGRTGHDAAWDLLTQAYTALTGKPLPETAVTPRGKPYFVEDSLFSSLSHTPRHAFCVLSRRPVGIDAEELDRVPDPRLAERILSPGELERYRCSPSPRRALLSLWVLKEAAAKCSGEGLRGYPNHTDFDPADPRVMELDGCLVAVLEQEDTHAL